MICTELLRSPYIGEQEAQAIEGQLQTRLGVDNATGFEQYRFVSGSLAGSWSSCIAANIKREEWVSCDDIRHSRRGKAPMLVPTLPYVTVEASVHKQMMGHNLFGGPACPVESARWFVQHVAALLGVRLPAADAWYFERVDVAEVFDLGNLAAVLEYKRALELARFPRRRREVYEGTVMFPGETTTWKGYAKGLEFKKHDYKRVLASQGKASADDLQELANKLLRVEVTVKPKLLRERAYKLGVDCRVASVGAFSQAWCADIYENETGKLMDEGQWDMNTVRNHDEVKRRLYTVYGSRLAHVLYGTWQDLALNGEAYVRQFRPSSTVRRHLNLLEDAAVSWLGSDVYVKEGQSLVPVGFVPFRSDARRLVGESPEVREKLAPFRIAA